MSTVNLTETLIRVRDRQPSLFDEKDKIELIEIYYKGDKENEDRERILQYYKNKR
jgi:hypothetical protein